MLLIGAAAFVGVRDNPISDINRTGSPQTNEKPEALFEDYRWIADSVRSIAEQNGEKTPQMTMAVLVSRGEAERVVGQPFPPERRSVPYYVVQASGKFTVSEADGSTVSKSYWTGVYIRSSADPFPAPVVVSWRDEPLDFSSVRSDAIFDPSTFPENSSTDYKK